MRRATSKRFPPRFPGRLRKLLPLSVMAFVAVASGFTPGHLQAEEPPAAEAADSLSSILNRQTRSAFDAVAAYVNQNPQADDIDRAYAWLFQTARLSGFDSDALPLAKEYLKRKELNEATAAGARQARILGLAVTGKMDAALGQFERELRGVQLRSPNATVDFALELAGKAQLSNNFDAARTVLERLSSAFFLNPYVRTLCENRLVRMELADLPAPKLETTDFDGKPVSLSDYEGKVLLVDFWATNCGPCLEDFPAVKQLYAEYHSKGFEIVGISLDEDRETVDAFQQRWKLPWRMVMSSANNGGVRERYRARTIPATYLVDRKGRIVRIDVRGHNLRRSVEQLLETGD